MSATLTRRHVGSRPADIDDRHLVLVILTKVPRDKSFVEGNVLNALGEAAEAHTGSMFVSFQIAPQQTTSKRVSEIVNWLAGQGYLQRSGRPPQLRCQPKVAQVATTLRQSFNHTQLQACDDIAAKIVELAEKNPQVKQGA